MGAIGVKLGKCGTNRIIAANRIMPITTMDLGVISFKFIFVFVRFLFRFVNSDKSIKSLTFHNNNKDIFVLRKF